MISRDSQGMFQFQMQVFVSQHEIVSFQITTSGVGSQILSTGHAKYTMIRGDFRYLTSEALPGTNYKQKHG